jgi:pyruvate carboxylase subunit B
MGTLPGTLAPEIVTLAKEKGMEFYTGNPQDEYPDELPKFRKMMDEEGWDYGQDDEELFELAMHERQYRDYKSGIAKERFNKDLADLKAKSGAPIVIKRPVVEMPEFDIDKYIAEHPKALPLQAPAKGKMLWEYDVVDTSKAPTVGTKLEAGKVAGYVQTYYGMEEIIPAKSGRVVAITAPQGKDVVKGEIVAFVEE